MMRTFLVAAACLAILSCKSEPPSPLILGAKPEDKTLGQRELTASQSQSLRTAITSAGHACAAVERAYLGDVDFDRGSEEWAVRCLEGSYQVRISAEAPAATVYRCRDWPVDDIPCFEGYRNGPSRRARTPGELNPDLGKLLEPMTTQGGKVD